MAPWRTFAPARRASGFAAAGLFAASLLAALGVRAQEPPSVSEAAPVRTGEDAAVERIAERLRSDASLRPPLARRILESSLADMLSGSGGARTSEEEMSEWIRGHPLDAARLAFGFAQDDRSGSRGFERSLHERVIRWFELNPRRYQGILGVLAAAGSQSKVILQATKLSEEEQRELLKHIFEGRGGESNKVLTGPGGGPSSGASAGAGTSMKDVSPVPAVAAVGIYDRISAANPTGYSPAVLAYQSRFNAERIPGAPRLAETGRLDAATLMHPVYALRYDLDRLDKEFHSQEAWELAKLLGREREFAEGRFKNPQALAESRRAAAGRGAPASRTRGRSDLDAAARSLEDLRGAAEKAKDPSRITPSLLKDLGRRQRETSRWITAASLAADIDRLEALRSSIFTNDLQDLLKTCPVPNGVRTKYVEQGARLDERLTRVIDIETRAAAELEGPNFLRRWDTIDQNINEARRLRSGLVERMMLYSGIPHRIRETSLPKSFWKRALDPWAARLAPHSAWGRRVINETDTALELLNEFNDVAAGDFAAAFRSAAEAAVIQSRR